MSCTHDACLLQLVHQATCTVVADGELTLNQAGRTALLADYQTGCVLEHRIEVLHVNITTFTATFALISIRLWQLEGAEITLLLGNEVVDTLHFRGVNEGTLHTNRLATIEIEHITTTYQLLCSRAVQNGA